MKLQTKLSILFLVLTLLPLIIVGVLSYQTGQKAIRENTANHLVSTNLLKMAELERWIADNTLILEAVAKTPFFMDAFPTFLKNHDTADTDHEKVHAEIRAQMLPLLRAGGMEELFILRASDGLTLVSTDQSQAGKYQDEAPYFVDGKEKTHVQNVYYSMSIQKPTMTVSTPLKDKNGKTIAVLAGRLDLSSLSAIMTRRSGMSRTEDTYLVNKFNFFVTEPRFGKNYALKKSVHTQGVVLALAGQSGLEFYQDYRGEPVMGSYQWVEKWDLAIITEIDQKEAFAPIYRLRRTTVLLGLVVGMAAVLIGIGMARTIALPLDRLSQGVEAVGQGDLETKITSSAKGEIGDLARTFEQMRTRLKMVLVSRNELTLEVARRKKAEQTLQRDRKRLLAILDGIEDVIYVADPDTYELLHVNEALKANWKEALIGKKCHKVLQNRDAPCPFCTNEKIFGEYLGKSYVWEFQNEISKQWYRCSDKAIQWVDGRMVRFEIAADITRLKTVEEKLKNTNANLERSNRELEQFAYVASHDLQEPLRMVASYTQLLAERYKEQLDEKAQKYIYYAVDGATRMQGLIRDLLAYSRVTTRGGSMKPVDSREVLDAALTNLEAAIAESGAVITQDELPSVWADKTQLTQLFQNLISNAIKFKGKNPPKIHVSAEKKDRFWEFQVSDNGIGIDPDYTEKVFIIFQRLHTRREYPGTGIGLAVCKRIVQRHGGKIWFESEPGKNTVFHFSIREKKPPVFLNS